MIRGRNLLGIVAAAAVSACTTGDVEVRPIAASKLTATTASGRVNEGRAKLAMGSVGLALESFRRALREDPSSIDALVGLAACYEQMGRFDLSSTHYEAALAIAPASVDLLDRLAASREAEGKRALAADLRREAALRRATPKSPPPALESAEEVAMAELALVTPNEPRTVLATPDPARPLPKAAEPVVMASVAPSGAPSAMTKAATNPVAVLPAPALPLVAMPSAAAVAALIGQDDRLSLSNEPVAEVATVRNRGPKLVRVSMGEIALVMSPETLWDKPLIATHVAARPAEVRLLNAARVAKLAARTRENMGRRGWNNISIGDAPQVLATSVIRYPAHARTAAHRLAAQYGFAVVADPSVKFITVYLGRDSAVRS